ncbi:hypothetical protein ACP70R_020057 [Stipagrostis hirtigluma subsp. patula]
MPKLASSSTHGKLISYRKPPAPGCFVSSSHWIPPSRIPIWGAKRARSCPLLPDPKWYTGRILGMDPRG